MASKLTGAAATPLAKKVGISRQMRVTAVGAPTGYRALLEPLGFVDVKVCAIDEVWSGLKLVVRKELRRDRASPADARVGGETRRAKAGLPSWLGIGAVATAAEPAHAPVSTSPLDEARVRPPAYDLTAASP